MPITWKNINSGGTADALAAITAAGKSINTGLDNFGGIIDKRAAIEDENFVTQGTMNTQAFKDKLATYQTPEALLAAQASGEIDAFGKSLGANIDRNVLRDGFDTQLADARNKQTDAYNYDQTVLDQQAAPLVERIRSSMINGTDADTTAMINADSALLARSGNLATIQKEYDERNRTEVDRTRSDDEYAYNENARDQTDKANDLMGQVIAESSSAEQARAVFSQRAREAGIDPRYSTGVMGEADARFQSQFGLTTTQSEDLNAYNQTLSVLAEGETAKADQELAEIKMAKPVNPAFVPEKVYETTLGDVTTFMATELGIEDPDSANDLFKSVEATVQKRLGDRAGEYRPALAAIALEAVKRLGAEDSFFSWGKGINEEGNRNLAGTVEAVFDEYVASEANRLKVEKATKGYQDRINEIKVGTDGAATQFRENLRNFNKSFAR